MWKGSRQIGKTFFSLLLLWGNLLINMGQAWPKLTLFQDCSHSKIPFLCPFLQGKVGSRILNHTQFGQENLKKFLYIRVEHASKWFRDPTNVTSLELIVAAELWLLSQICPLRYSRFPVSCFIPEREQNETLTNSAYLFPSKPRLCSTIRM